MEELQPHAWVQYRLDKVKRKVPISFIKSFDSSNVKHNHSYWVFWSGKNDDSPSQMLKRVSKIPQFEKTEDVVTEYGAGYYRATISVVKDSLIELDKYLETNRPKEKSEKLISDSFSKSPSNIDKLSKSKNSLDSSKEIKQEDKIRLGPPSREKKLNKTQSRQNTLKNVDEVRNSLELNCFNKNVVKSTPDQVSLSSDKNRGSKSRKRPRPTEDTSSDGDDSEDPSLISPTKYRRLLDERDQMKAEIFKVRSLDERLQSRLLDCTCGGLTNVNGTSAKGREIKNKEPPRDTTKRQDDILSHEPANTSVTTRENKIKASNAAVTGTASAVDTEKASAADTEKASAADTEKASAADTETPCAAAHSPPISTNTVELDPSDSDELLNTDSNCEQRDGGNTLVLDKNSSSFDPNKAYEFYPGRYLDSKVKENLWACKKTDFGPKGDSMFVKTVAVMAWGSAYLATHNVTSKKKSKDEPANYPPLDEMWLSAVKRLLKARVEREESHVVDEKHPRLAKTRVHNFIKEKIKTLRASVFGTTKAAAVTTACPPADDDQTTPKNDEIS